MEWNSSHIQKGYTYKVNKYTCFVKVVTIYKKVISGEIIVKVEDIESGKIGYWSPVSFLAHHELVEEFGRTPNPSEQEIEEFKLTLEKYP